MIYHVAPFADNAGDIVIVDACQRLFRDYIDHDIIDIEDWREDYRDYNRARAVIVGGGGMFIPDTKRNNNSGWRWNINTRQMSRIKVPLVGFAIGYNRFRGQEDFHTNFSASLNSIIRQSVFFGLREQAGIDRLIPYTRYTDLVAWQPCPAQLGKILYPEITAESKGYAVFAPAMDRQHLRGDVRRLLPALRHVVDSGYHLIVATHISADKEIIALLKDVDYSFHDLRGRPANEILQFYAGAEFVIGMRLHSLLIPFGFQVPIIPVVSHDKISDWLMDIGHPGWAVDLNDPDITEKMMWRIGVLATHYDASIQNVMWDVTMRNIGIINKAIDG